ncbi:hypothetical protein DSO57_1004009 [Entomophthora muscae]|uniref:Uncharacterized protein n=1 Tax=Entomophthora muscae TaxID=34485 RepID=A0ACC2SLT2_9FUNG|nr:hypothetical protein DSO57_1004009 [Entomophthora muscae]
MPRNYYPNAGIVYFCSNLIILFTSIWESITQYKLAYLYPPGYTPATSLKPPCALDLEYFHPHHLDLPPGYAKEIIPPDMKEILTAPPAQRASCSGLQITPIVYMAFQAQPASPVGVQPDSGMGCGTLEQSGSVMCQGPFMLYLVSSLDQAKGSCASIFLDE